MKVRIEVFSSPGCSKCGHARDVLRKLAEELGAGRVEWREVNILEDMDRAVALGVMSTPAIAFDGELVFSGLPSAKKLRQELEKRLLSRSGVGASTP